MDAVQTDVIPADDPQAIDRALGVLRLGQPIAFPTDTVYGVGVLISDAAGIEKLYAIKERDAAKAIAVLLSSPTELPQVTARMGEMASRLAQRFWPGPLTLVVARHPSLPENLSPVPTIGVRMPDHPAALALLRRAGPMAVTSANLSGASSASTAAEALAQLGGRIPLILDGGRSPGGVSSTVVDCTGEQPVILRPGPLSLDDLLVALQE